MIGYQYDRFFLGVCLGLAILAGIGLDWIVESLRPRAVGLAIASAVLIVGVLSGASVPILMHADSRYVVEGWLSEHARPGTVVAFTGRQEYLPRLAPFQGVADAGDGGPPRRAEAGRVRDQLAILAAGAGQPLGVGLLRGARGRAARLPPRAARALRALDAPWMDRSAVVRRPASRPRN